MKKVIICILFISILGFGCTKEETWKYQMLPNQYELWKIAKKEYKLGLKNGEQLQLISNKIKIGVKGNITSFSVYEDRYIAIKIEEELTTYAVIDTLEKEVLGPLNNEEELDYKLNALGITKPEDWLLTQNIKK